MKHFVCEWASGGGAWWDDLEPSLDDPFVSQGHKMVTAYVSDLLALGHSVTVSRDIRFDHDLFLRPIENAQGAVEEGHLTIVTAEESVSFDLHLVRGAASADRVMAIAPETGGRLLACSHWLKMFRKRCMFPTGDFLVMASSKTATAAFLQKAFPDNPAYRGVCLDASAGDAAWPPAITLPAVIKPDDGAGSEGLQFVRHDWTTAARPTEGLWRVEPYIPGIAASVAVIGCRSGFRLLEPMYQMLDADNFRYLDARHPMRDTERERVLCTVTKALEHLPTFRGYVGIDLILHELDPARDTIVDLNPRLTTSYTAQRSCAAENLASEIIAAFDD